MQCCCCFKKRGRIPSPWNPPTGAAAQFTFLVVTIPIAYHIGVFKEEYFSFGPSPGLVFFGLVINSWEKLLLTYLAVAVMQAVESFAGNVIGPWEITDVLNIYIDPKKVRYSLSTTYTVATINYIYDALNYVVTLHTTLSSVQFIVVRSLVDFSLLAYNIYWCSFKVETPQARGELLIQGA